jgi:Serine hydrolase (FSH1)
MSYDTTMTSNPSAVSAGIHVATQTLRILCLHDSESNASELKKEFQDLGNLLYTNHTIDLVYVNSPLIVSSCESSSLYDFSQSGQKCVWWDIGKKSDKSTIIDGYSQYCVDSDATVNVPTQDENEVFRGLDASLMLLRQIWNSCPFWGIVGVGQGAAMASLFVATIENDILSYRAQLSTGPVVRTDQGPDAMATVSCPPLFPQLIIFISGETILSIDEPLLVHLDTINESTIPFILHMVDCNSTPEQELLTRQYPNGCSIQHRRKRNDLQGQEPKSRCFFCSHDLNLIGRFICERKKGLYGIDSSHTLTSDESTCVTTTSNFASHREVLALQTALFNAEQEAVNCIADAIASNPPASLMAVLRPQTVAGWSGNRRLQPEGGGAPCPKEFKIRDRGFSSSNPPFFPHNGLI